MGAYGSPAAVIGNRRDSVDAKDRRKIGIVPGWHEMVSQSLPAGRGRAHLVRVQDEGANVTMPLAFDVSDSFRG